MALTIVGIRREDKNRWEARVPLIPADIADLQVELGVRFVVQPSAIRAFGDDEFRAAGVRVDDDLSKARLVLAVKEVPKHLLRAGKVYCEFAHVAKGQRYNMPMLARVLELGATLLDYEKISDESNRRLLFFGRHAGHAGTIDTLHLLGERLRREGIETPFVDVKPAHAYRDLADARAHLAQVGERIARDGLPEALRPIVFGVTGYGNVSQGVSDILELLPCQVVPVGELATAARRPAAPGGPPILKVVFREEDTVRPRDRAAAFDLPEYFAHPERYEARFEDHLPHLDVLLNTIYWEPRYPRLVTVDWARRAWGGGGRPRLRVIGDISCDIRGSIELTVKSTESDAPAFVWGPDDDAAHEDLGARGPVIMAVDNLPCELPRESSRHFSSVLRGMLPELVRADWDAPFEALALPHHLKKALIAHRGALAPGYAYLAEHLKDLGAPPTTAAGG